MYRHDEEARPKPTLDTSVSELLSNSIQALTEVVTEGQITSEEVSKVLNDLNQVETEVSKQAMLLYAQRRLMDEGLPLELLDALNTTSEAAFNKSLELIGNVFRIYGEGLIDWPSRYEYLRINQINPEMLIEHADNATRKMNVKPEDLIRAAMELPEEKEAEKKPFWGRK